VWPPEFALRAQDDQIQVLDGQGQVVARVGQEICMGGGGSISDKEMPDCVLEQLPLQCRGSYFVVGDTVRPNLKRDSDLFTLDVVSTTERSVILIHKTPLLDEWAENDGPLIGTLVLWDDERIPHVQFGDGAGDYRPLWPAGHRLRITDGEVEIADGSGHLVARVGDEVRLDGGEIPLDWDSPRYRRLHDELPCDCWGPYWIVAD
jgi:hypothetical protein